MLSVAPSQERRALLKVSASTGGAACNFFPIRRHFGVFQQWPRDAQVNAVRSEQLLIVLILSVVNRVLRAWYDD